MKIFYKFIFNKGVFSMNFEFKSFSFKYLVFTCLLVLILVVSLNVVSAVDSVPNQTSQDIISDDAVSFDYVNQNLLINSGSNLNSDVNLKEVSLLSTNEDSVNSNLKDFQLNNQTDTLQQDFSSQCIIVNEKKYVCDDSKEGSDSSGLSVNSSSIIDLNSSDVNSSILGPGLVYKKGVNEKVSEKDLSAYLKYYTRDNANDDIKSLAKILTKNCKNDLEKATVIFNYVRDYVSYSYYYNSVYYATGTYSKKSANCCDKSNLLVSLYKSAGLAARYNHATCTFSNGLRIGYVWTQVYVDGVWYVGDATSSRNSLGHVNNWDLNSMSGLGQYSELPF